MGSTLTTFDALLKERYIDSSKVEELVYPQNVLLGMLEKRGDTGMVGSKMPIPIITKNPQGVSGTFAQAQANASNIGADEFLTTAGDYFGVVTIGDKVLKASRTNAGAFLENKITEIDGLYETAMDSLSLYAWGNGGQALGRIASIAGNVVRLESAADVANFEVGMSVVASANDGSTSTDSLIDSGDSAAVSGINRATGDVTLNAVSDISGLAVGNYLFREGDFFGTTGTIVVRGVQAFITATDTPGALWGVSAATRLTDVQRWSGCRVDPATLAGLSIDQRIKRLFSQMTGRFKAKAPTVCFMHPEDFDTLETVMATKGIRPLEDESTQFGYTKIDVMTGSGRIPIYSDRHCPAGSVFALRMENWWISSMGELLHVQNGDGMQMLRKSDSTDYEFRLLSYPILACNAPKNNGRITLS